MRETIKSRQAPALRGTRQGEVGRFRAACLSGDRSAPVHPTAAAFTSSSITVAERFHVSSPPELRPRYNIAPRQDVLCVIRNRENHLEPLRWGLIPFWAKDPAIGNRLINARAETVAKKPSFRNAFAKHRCVIVVDGFYEWKRDGKRKVLFYIFLKSRKPFSFAGLYEHWNDLDGNEIRSCTIITTDSNELVSPLHNRMPVILPEDDEEL